MKPTFKYDHKKKTLMEALGLAMHEEQIDEKIADIVLKVENSEQASQVLAEVIRQADSVEEAVILMHVMDVRVSEVAMKRARDFLERPDYNYVRGLWE